MLNLLTIENVEARISIKILLTSSLIGIETTSPFRKSPLIVSKLMKSSIGKPRFKVSATVLLTVFSMIAKALEDIPVTLRFSIKEISKLSYKAVMIELFAGALTNFNCLYSLLMK